MSLIFTMYLTTYILIATLIALIVYTVDSLTRIKQDIQIIKNSLRE